MANKKPLFIERKAKESYSDYLERLCNVMADEFPEIPEIVKEFKRIQGMSNSEFDYEIERTHLLYNLLYLHLKN